MDTSQDWQPPPVSVGGVAEYPQLEAAPGASGSSAPGTFAVAGIATGAALLRPGARFCIGYGADVDA